MRQTIREPLFLVVALALVLTILVSLAGCNGQVVDTVWRYDAAEIALPGGEVVSGPVTSWRDYADSDMVQVTIGGRVYYTHGSNVVLIAAQSKGGQAE